MAALMSEAVESPFEQETKRKEISTLLLTKHALPKDERPICQKKPTLKAHWISEEGEAREQEVGRDEVEFPLPTNGHCIWTRRAVPLPAPISGPPQPETRNLGCCGASLSAPALCPRRLCGVTRSTRGETPRLQMGSANGHGVPRPYRRRSPDPRNLKPVTLLAAMLPSARPLCVLGVSVVRRARRGARRPA